MKTPRTPFLASTLLALTPVATASAAFVQYLNNKPGWLADTGSSTTVGFSEFANGTIVTDQYTGLGLDFVDGDDTVTLAIPWAFPEDGAGLLGGASITMSFAEPITWIGFDFPDLIKLQFFLGGKLLHTSGPLGAPGGAFGGFAGFTSTDPFDLVVVSDWGGPPGQIELDTIYFQSIPTPACALLPLAALVTGRRRRSG